MHILHIHLQVSVGGGRWQFTGLVEHILLRSVHLVELLNTPDERILLVVGIHVEIGLRRIRYVGEERTRTRDGKVTHLSALRNEDWIGCHSRVPNGEGQWVWVPLQHRVDLVVALSFVLWH